MDPFRSVRKAGIYYRAFNLSMKKGEIISVVGESGSGKTTVIRAVLGALAGGGG